MALVQQQAGKTFEPFGFKPRYMDGRDATNVKNDMGLSWYNNVKTNLSNHISANYPGVKAQLIPGNRPDQVPESSSRFDGVAFGFQGKFIQLAENKEDPEASYMEWTNLVSAIKMDVYG